MDINTDTTDTANGSSYYVSVHNYVQPAQTLEGVFSYWSASEARETEEIETLTNRTPNEASRQALSQLREDDLNEYDSVEELRNELT